MAIRGTNLRVPHREVAVTTTAAGLILARGADGRSSYVFSSFQIRMSPGGVGFGGFAIADIVAGDCILAEAPIAACVVPDRKRISGASFAATLHRELSLRDDVQLAAYFSLAQLPDSDSKAPQDSNSEQDERVQPAGGRAG
jgi:hypothetical protein